MTTLLKLARLPLRYRSHAGVLTACTGVGFAVRPADRHVLLGRRAAASRAF